MKYRMPLELLEKLKTNLSAHAVDKDDLQDLASDFNFFLEGYTTVLKCIKKTIWFYEYKTDSIYTTASSESYFKYKKILEHLPDDIFSLEIVHTDSYEVIKNIHKQLEQKELNGQFEVRLPDMGSQEIWVQVQYETIFNEDKTPAFSVFMGDNVSDKKQSQFHYHEDLDMLLVVSDDILMSAKVNVTKNVTEYFARNSDNMENRANYETLEQLRPCFLSSINDKVDYKKLFHYFDQDFLLKTAASGAQEKKYEFQFTQKDGIIKWMEGFIRFFHTSDGLYCYYYVRDIDHLKRVEHDLEKQAKYDKLTGVYNRETGLAIAKELINKEHKDFVALLLFNIDNVTQLIRNDGYASAEKVLVSLTALTNRTFDGEKVVARSDGFEIIVVLIDSRNTDEVKEMVKKILKQFKNKFLFPEVISPVTVSTGICFADTEQPRKFSWYYQNARVALDSAKQNGKDRYETFHELKDKYCKNNFSANKNTIQKYENDEVHKSSSYSDLSPEFLKWERDQFVNIEFVVAVKGILKKICQYYSSDRAFCFFNKKGVVPVDMGDFWVVESIEDALVPSDKEMQVLFNYNFNMFLSGESLLYNSIERLKTENSEIYAIFSKSDISSFYDYPVYVNGELKGYIGVDNPRHNKGKFDILYSVANLIGVEKNVTDLKKQISYLKQYDMLSGVQNRQSLSSYLKKLNVNKLSSIGIGVVRIYKLKTLNNSYGRENIDTLIQYVSNTICSQFDKSSVYRRSGNEFIVIQENIDYEAFDIRLEKVQAESANSYQGIVAIGSAWVDNEIDVDSLIFSADSSLRENVPESVLEKKLLGSKLIYDNYDKLKNDIESGRYHLYLQPKADFSNRAITAAEALIRYKDDNGNIVTPANFIHKFEKTGIIHLIDFYVLDEVCKFLDKQIKRGRKDFIISLNFSRRTLLVKDLIKRMKEITEKYDVPSDKIEIEITESVGDVEQRTISALGKKINDAGYRLSLDDFGSRFCNMDVLSNMKLDALKLDKSLVKDVYANERSRKVIENFLTTCRQLEIESIAEGVETEDQFEILKQMGCDIAQGYLFNKPIPAEEFERQYLTR